MRSPLENRNEYDIQISKIILISNISPSSMGSGSYPYIGADFRDQMLFGTLSPRCSSYIKFYSFLQGFLSGVVRQRSLRISDCSLSALFITIHVAESFDIYKIWIFRRSKFSVLIFKLHELKYVHMYSHSISVICLIFCNS